MRLNPFKDLPQARQVWAWGMYDLANQSFTLLVVTLFLPIYFSEQVLGPGAPEGRAVQLLGFSIAAASLVVVLASPVLGALADFSGRKKLFLTSTGLGCAALTASLALTGPGDVLFTLVIFALANILFMFGENFLAAFLPEVSTRETVGKVSAIGWTMGYVGALLCLPCALLLPGLARKTSEGFGALFLFAGVWFLLNALPTMLILQEKKKPEPMPAGQTIATVGFTRVLDTIGQASRYQQLAVFLLFFCIYCCGMQAIINFSGLLVNQYLKSPVAIIAFVEVLALISAIGSFVSGAFQDRIGQRLTVQISLVVWIATALAGMALPSQNAPFALLALVGCGIGLGLGLTGAASRALVGVLTPAHKTAEFFALWGLGYKIANIVGPLLYGIVFAGFGQRWAMFLVAAFFLIGFAGTFLVDVEAGRRAAEDAEHEFAKETDERDIAAAARISGRELQAVRSVSDADAG